MKDNNIKNSCWMLCLFLVFIANFILAQQDSYIQFNPYNKLRLSPILPNPYDFYHNIYSINKPNQDLAPFKPVLNENYFSYLNTYKPYLLYKNIWGTNNWNYTVDKSNTFFIIYEKITLPNTITSSGKKYTYNTKLPFIISIKEYINQRIKINNLIAYHTQVLSNFKAEEKPSQFKTGIYLLNKKIGDTHVSINLSGNISIECDLCYDEKSQQILGNNSDSQWDLEVEQSQSFSLESIIGNKLSIKADQNSMSDFDWENSLLLEYKGDENEIVKNITAGNISLNLPGTRIVSVGMGKRTGLFGIKIENQFGPLNMQTIIGREKVSKSSISRSRDGSSEEGYTDIADYTFLRDTYFFIDKKFKENFYPIGLQGQVLVDTCYEIDEFELFEKSETSFGYNDNNTGTYSGAAYVNPGNMDDFGFGITGTWRKLEKGEDYYIDIERGMKKRGYIRLSGSTYKIIAAHYTIKECSLQETPNTGTDMDFVYNNDFIADECLNENDCINNDSNLTEGIDYIEFNGDPGFQGAQLTLKLIKEATGTSDPFNCPSTYPLMFKNVYNLAGQNIDQNSLDVKIIHKNGNTGNETNLDGRPLLKIFGLDNVDNVTQQIDTTSGGDGRIDVSNGAILNLLRGDLLLPFHMPFAFEDREAPPTEQANPGGKIWGNIAEELRNYIVKLSNPVEMPPDTEEGNPYLEIYSNGPAMYYDAYDDPSRLEEYEFIIRVKHSSSSNQMNLGFMVVENSETVLWNNSEILIKGIDYTIDYFTGTITWISQKALDPTADITVSCDNHELISFDQKIMAGTFLNYEFSPNNLIYGGLYYYTQALKDQKVEIGQEPMENKIWNIGGSFSHEFENINKYINSNSYLNFDIPSKIDFDFEYAEVYPNPNPLGVGYIDDFEGSKKYSYISTQYTQYNKSSPPSYKNPIDNSNIKLNNFQRIDMAWFTKSIPIQSIWSNYDISGNYSGDANKQSILELEIKEDSKNYLNDTTTVFWNGITLLLNDADRNQSNNEYLDLWINSNETDTSSRFIFNIDIGHISEDINENGGDPDTEDKDIEGTNEDGATGFGDGFLQENEDIGLDVCIDAYEDGWGGCLCPSFNTVNECTAVDAITYTEALASGSELINPNTNSSDPNRDTYARPSGTDEADKDYSGGNKTEGNGSENGIDAFKYPDTEDLDSDLSLNAADSYYFTYSFDLHDVSNPMIISYDGTDGNDADNKGDWKLYRIPLKDFETILEDDTYTIAWENVKHFRMWVRAENIVGDNYIKIAKIEVVGNEWRQLGVVDDSNSLYGDNNQNLDFEINSLESNGTISSDTIQIDENITIQVVNTEENSTYAPPLGIVGNYDIANERYEKEQSLSIDFTTAGIESNKGVFIKRNFDYSSGDMDQSFFIYKNIEMFIQSINEGQTDWYQSDTSQVELSFRFGREGHYYELRQPLSDDNTIPSLTNTWTKFKANLDQLTNYKNNRFIYGEDCEDWGIDHCRNDYEAGFLEDICLPTELNLTNQQICNDACNDDECSKDIAIENGWIIYDLDYDFGEFTINDGDDSVPFDFQDVCMDYYCTSKTSEATCLASNENCEWVIDENGDGCLPVIPLIVDPHQDNASSDLCYDNIQCYDESDSCEQGEAAVEGGDLNNNGIFDEPAYAYDNINNVYYWDDGASYCPNGSDVCEENEKIIVDLDNICEDCSRLSIGGDPAINRIDYIMVGILNETDYNNTIYGSVYINELRMTGVKKDKGQKFIVDGSFNLGELLTLTASHSRENHDYHMLEERISHADYSDYQSLNINLDITELFKENFVDMPISASVTKNFKSPKYQPGSDIILGDVDDVDEAFQYNKTTRMANISVRPKLSNVYDNLLVELVDNVRFDYTYSNSKLSSEIDKKNDSKVETYTYNYIDSKSDSELEDYTFQPFKNIKISDESKHKTFLEKVQDFKIYFRPKKIVSTGYLTINESQTISRTSLDTININSKTYTKTFKIDDYKLLPTFNTDYSLTMTSNISEGYYADASNLIDPWSPIGDLKSWIEAFSFTYSPDYAEWLSPTISFNPKYTWNKNLSSAIDNPAASIRSDNRLTVSFNFSFQKFIELFYKSGTSTSTYSNSYSQNSSNNNSSSKLEIKDHYIKSFLKFLHTLSKKLSTFTITTKYNTLHTFSNINANFDPKYNFRLGFYTEPEGLDLSISDIGGLLTSNSNYYENYFNISTSIQVTDNLSLSSMKYEYLRKKTDYSDAESTINVSNTFFPLGANGRGGLPMFNYSINLNGLEKFWGLDKWFKSISLAHNYSGSEAKTYKDYQGVLTLEKVDFSKDFSPLISFTMKINDIEKTPKINEEDFSFTLRFNNLLTIYNTFDQIHRDVRNEITFGTSYTTDTDIRIKLPKNKFLELKNDMTFRLDLSYSEESDAFAYVLTNDLDKFTKTSFSKNINLKPSMTYNFSKFVSGEIFVTHIITESNTSGKSSETCFGFEVMILFESMDTNNNPNNYQTSGGSYSPYF